MHVTGKREGQELWSEGAPEPKAKIGYEHEKIRTTKLENLGERAHSNKGKKRVLLLIKIAVWNTLIQMCNQKPVTNKTYKRNTLKQLSSCLNRTPACGSLSQGRKQIFPFCVASVSSEGESCTSNNRTTSEQFDRMEAPHVRLYELTLGEVDMTSHFPLPPYQYQS